MKSITLILFFSSMLFKTDCQNSTHPELLKLIYESKHYVDYRTLMNNSSLFLKDNDIADAYNQRMGVLHSFFGNYKEAIKCFNLNYRNNYPNLDTNEFKKYLPITANKILDSLSKRNQIIIINEAHHIPQHRVTTIELLELLYKNGYHYLAMETLDQRDTELNNRGYPLIDKSGFYTDEPCSGDLVRTAIKIGYILVAYEAEGDFSKRFKGQAQNLVENVFLKDPKAKLIIHSGNMNGLDIEMGEGVGLMGYYLKKLTGIDPLVINQADLSEDTEQSNERLDYQYALNIYDVKEPTIFINNEGKIWHYYQEGDIALFLPRSDYKNGRPTWLTLNEKKQYYFVNLNHLKIQPPFLIQAFFEKEGLYAVPIDQIEISDISKNKALVLYKGKYIIRIINSKGESLLLKKIKIY